MNTIDDFFRTMNNWFHLIVGAPLIVFVLIYLEVENGHAGYFGNRALTADVILITVISGVVIFWGSRQYGKGIKESWKLDKLEDKIALFRKVVLIRAACYTVAGVLALLWMYLAAHKGFAIIYFVSLFLASINRPDLVTMNNQLRLEGEDQEKVIHKKE